MSKICDNASETNFCETPTGANSGYGALQCNPRSSGCPGSANNNCYPNNVWAGTLKSGTNYYLGNLNSGTFYARTSNEYLAYTYALTVRCVLDLTTDKLCDGNSGYGALRCSNKSSGCPGSYNNNCNPNYMWSGTAQSSSGYYPYYLNSGTLNASSNYTYTYAYSVRCVLDLKKHKKLNITKKAVSIYPQPFYDI